MSDLSYLQSLPAVKRVSVTGGRLRITYEEGFRRMVARRYRAGDSPARIFREAGLDSALIGYKRIERCIARWRDLPDEDVPPAPPVPAEAVVWTPSRPRVKGVEGRATVRTLARRVTALEARLAAVEAGLSDSTDIG
ncbi:hypothetical protein Tam10B_1505 [Bifidobacterium vansinderenii]|nr:hypothetical protein Tam10B_1505 [Bifidobacterium vansinderenii]